MKATIRLHYRAKISDNLYAAPAVITLNVTEPCLIPLDTTSDEVQSIFTKALVDDHVPLSAQIEFSGS
jgi:hypothetical protein